MRHRTEIPKKEMVQGCGNQRQKKLIINLYKVKEHVSMSSFATWMRDL
jgi:hypothetical protein